MHSLKILILEDHPFQLMALHQMLNASGVYDVLAAESVASAKEMLARHGPVDVAICDLYLDGDDGLSLIRHLAQERLASSLIILSDAEPVLLERVGELARQLGVRLLGSVAKPANSAILHRLLSHYREVPATTEPQEASAQVFELASLSAEQLARSREQWRVQYQPRVDAEGRLVAVEAVVGWQHPTLGLLAPGQFFTVLKGAGLLDMLTWHLLEQALALSAAITGEDGRPLPVAVGLPSSQLLDAGSAARLQDLLARLQLPGSVLTLELDESHCDRMSSEAWAALRSLGCRLSLDGFSGTLLSLPQLTGLPLHELKLPVAALRGMGEDGRKAAAVAGALILARRLELKVVIVGVETPEDWAIASKLGRPVRQGHFIARPMPAGILLEWLSAREAVVSAREQGATGEAD